MSSIFSNRDLPCDSWGKPRAIAIAYRVLAISWAALTNNTKGDSHACGIFVMCPLTLGWSIASSDGIYIYS